MWVTATRDLEFTQGQTVEYSWTFTGVDMTGWTGRSHIRDKEGNLLADLTTENGGVVITAGANSIVTLKLTDTQSSAVTATGESLSDLHGWDIELIASASRIEKPFRGKVVVHREQTR